LPIIIDSLLRQVGRIDGVLMACLVDPATGTVLGAGDQRTEIGVPVAAAGAADALHVLNLMTAQLALGGEVEDVVVTLTKHVHLIRVLPTGPDHELALLVTFDRPRTNLAMAQREIRDLTDPR
jgi:hypothetical protein